MSGQSDRNSNTTTYYITPGNNRIVWAVIKEGAAYAYETTNNFGIKPSLNLKSNVIITSGDGTKQNPFQLSVE